ncbi:MAG: alkaline phosphatase family protein [Planctomycetaceae bacterium]|nr:alkaline phosphatase family protein [Planctomycetaceae bacterium]
MRNRILIIGADGFSWRFAKKLIDRGHMPTLGRLRKEGGSGTLNSVVPFETSPAWSSFQTGCLPSKTGILAFHRYNSDSRQIKLNSSSEIAVPTIWELLSAAGKRIVSINMPLTSPPPDVNGIIIPGLTCPQLSAQTVHPPELFEKYIRKNPDYLIVNNEHQATLLAGAKQAADTEEARCRLALEIMRQTDWDLFCVQIQSTDVFQHRYWWALDPEAAGFSDEAHNQAATFYARIDAVIAALTNAAGPSVLTVLVSDHGFCAKRAEIGINSWLRQNGFLSLNLDQGPASVLLKEKIKAAFPPAKWLARLYGLTASRLRAASSGREKKSALYSETVVRHIRETIDMEHSFAFCLGGMAGLLYVLDKKQGERAALLISQLMNAYGPNSLEPLIAQIQPIAEFCAGVVSDASAPDYIIRFLPGVEARISPEDPAVVKSGIVNGKQSGTHEQDGMFLMHGESVIPADRLEADIIDMSPTLLAYMGVAIPDHIDGKVRGDLFRNPPDIHYAKGILPQRQATTYSETDQTEVEKRLADLGYL